MPSEFDLAMEGARDVFLSSAFSDSFTYRQMMLPDWTLTAMLSRDGVDAQIYGVLYVRLADFATAPAEGDFVIYGGKVFRVVQINPGQFGDAELSLRLDTREPVEPPA